VGTAPSPNALVYVCGPRRLIEAARAPGIAPERVPTETFE
jgi:ferredoxin-NADP reductase